MKLRAISMLLALSFLASSGNACNGSDSQSLDPTGTSRQATSTAPDDLRMQLDARRELAMDLPYNFQQIIATHNSWNIDVAAYNQVDTITQQLDLGVRALYVDMYHWTDDVHVWLCHRACEVYVFGKIWSNDVPLQVFLNEVKAWLDVHPNEIISFQIEDHTGILGNGSEFQTEVESTFGSRWLKQSDRFAFFPDWTERMWPTPRQFLAGCQGSGCSSPGVSPKQLITTTLIDTDGARLKDNDHVKNMFHAHDFGKSGSSAAINFQSQPQQVGDLNCYKFGIGIGNLFSSFSDPDSNPSPTLQSGDMIGVEDDKAWTSQNPSQSVICTHDGSQWESGFNVPCVSMAGLLKCDVNVVSSDRFEETLARSSVHTWDSAEPESSSIKNCAAMNYGGYLSAQSCTEVYPFFCTRNHGTEAFLSRRQGVWTTGEAICAAEGGADSHFQGPAKVSQYWQVQQAVNDHAPLWINLTDTDHEGTWTAATGLSGTAISDYSPPILTAECPELDNTVGLSWTAGPADATSISLERSVHGANIWTAVSTECATTSSGSNGAPAGTCLDTAMTPGQTYDYRVTAVRGGLTTLSNIQVVFAQGPVTLVQGFSATVGNWTGSATLNWTIPATNNVDHYEIYRKDTLGGTPNQVTLNLSAGTRVSFEDTTIPSENDQLYYTIVSVNGSCRGRMVSETITPPKAPTNLVVTTPVSGQNKVRLTFTDNSFFEDRFVIYRQKDNGDMVEIAQSAPRPSWGQTASFEDFPEGNATYTYKVTARQPIYADSVESLATNSVSVTLGNVTNAMSLSYDYQLNDAHLGQKIFRFDPVGAGVFNLRFQIRTLGGSTGDADLYVAANRIPTLTDFDCRPFTSTANETCTISNPNANWNYGYLPYYVMVQGFTDYSNVELLVIQNELLPAQSFPIYYMAQGSGEVYTWSDQTSIIQINTTAANTSVYGDDDLYAACGMLPHLDPTLPSWAAPLDFEVFSASSSYTESVTPPQRYLLARPSRCFAFVSAYSTFGGINVSSTARGPG